MRSSTSLLSCVFAFYHQVCVWMQINRKHLRGKNIASFLFKNVEMKIHDVIHLAICPSTTRELCLAGDGGRFWGNPQKLQEVVVSHFMTAGHNEIRKTATTTKLWQFLREFACIVISLSQLHTATERVMETFENWNRGEMLQHQSQQSEMEHECKKQNKFHSNEEMNEERKINCLQNDSHHQIKY